MFCYVFVHGFLVFMRLSEPFGLVALAAADAHLLICLAPPGCTAKKRLALTLKMTHILKHNGININ